MRYHDGEPIHVGDVVTIDVRHEGLVVACIEDGIFLHPHTKEQWTHLHDGVLIDFFFNDTAPTEIYTLSLHDALPTSTPCAQCHTTGIYSAYSVTGTHQGVTSCLSCHGPTVGPFANVTMVTSATPGNHIPIGTLDCNGSGCHSTANVNPGGFMIGTA